MTRILFIGLLLLPVVTQAVKLGAGDYRYREDVEKFISDVAARSDFSEQQLLELFSQVKHQRHLFERMDKPAEKLQWHQYRKIFITDKRIQRGIEFWNKHAALLREIEHKYQVPTEIIVAIVGVETFYGAYHGKAPVFDTLVTFAFDYPKRAAFFTRELEQFLLLARDNNLPVREVKGSYAGAMGMPQFISSSYRAYAVDHDGDNKADLFDNEADVLASVANYFKRHGWTPGEAVAFPLSAGKNLALSGLEPGMKPNYHWSQLKTAGFTSEADISPETRVALLEFEQKEGKDYWMGLNNFYVITRYNHSPLYAMAVFQLSQKIKAGMGQ
jgi:membrane-bound lytic murein transglycosylase B